MMDDDQAVARDILYCPLCGYGPWALAFDSPAALRSSCEICPCCGCEYGYDDRLAHHEEWVSAGMKWFQPEKRPADWKSEDQLRHAIRPWPPEEN